jgi:ubiquinone/menaquinone biosynthesis C-methylase UbiE
MHTFSDPNKIIEDLPVFPGNHVADLGAGSGNYVFALAKKIDSDSQSRIFAVDIQKALLERIDAESQAQGYSCVKTVWGDIEKKEGSRLRQYSMDVVFIINTLFQVEHKEILVQEAHRILKPNGILVIIDWSDSFGNIGPREDHIFTSEKARELSEHVGFLFEKTFNTGEHHYGFIVRKLA